MKIRWEPFRELETFCREMDRAFRGFGAGLSNLAPRSAPQVNLAEDDETIYVEATASGMDPESLKITIERDTLTIAGERKAESDEEDREGRAWHMKERWTGSFKRTIDLPAEVDAEKVSAEYADGVLRVTLPKADVAKPHDIQIKYTK